jgi:dUTPase
MKRLFWSLLILGTYIWSVSTGRDQFVLNQGKRVVQMVIAWFSDAEVDFQVQHNTTPLKKKKARRWD